MSKFESVNMKTATCPCGKGTTSNELIRIAAENYPLDPTGAHGPFHWARVIDNGRLLAKRYNVNPRVPELFGAFHDCRRQIEDHDTEHGRLGMSALKELGLRDGLIIKEFQYVLYACKHHTVPRFRRELPIEIQICLDADRLDLLRIGIAPDPDYLFTRHAKSQAMRTWANERAKHNTPPEWLEL